MLKQIKNSKRNVRNKQAPAVVKRGIPMEACAITTWRQERAIPVEKMCYHNRLQWQCHSPAKGDYQNRPHCKGSIRKLRKKNKKNKVPPMKETRKCDRDPIEYKSASTSSSSVPSLKIVKHYVRFVLNLVLKHLRFALVKLYL